LDIVSVLEEWARWMAQRHFHGWPASTVLGRVLDGLPSTLCTLCLGKKWLQGAKFGLQGKIVCPRCSGQGSIKINDSEALINPAFISSTDSTYRIPKIQFNYLAHKVDLVVQTGLTRRQKQVTYLEYGEPGSQYRKAKILKISPPAYSLHLKKVHKKVYQSLTTG
jgi:hypothetical protein